MKIVTFLLLNLGAVMAAQVDVFFFAGQSNASGRADSGYVYDSRDSQVAYQYYTDTSGGIGLQNSGGLTTLGPVGTSYYGSEIAMGRDLVTAGYNPAIIKVALGGQALGGGWMANVGSLWSTWSEQASAALSEIVANGDTPVLRAFFWNQGETDAGNETNALAYQSNFQAFTAAVYDELSAYDSSNMQFVTALTHTEVNGGVWVDDVRTAQMNVMDSSSSYSYFDTVDLGTDPTMMRDVTHFNELGLNEIGSRFVAAYTQSVPEPSTGAFMLLVGAGVLFARRR